MQAKHEQLYRAIAQQMAKNVTVLKAIGDETRLHIIVNMMELPCQSQGGARVGQITAKTHLSRPAISHHLKILKEAGVVGMRSEGTKNYYYLTAEGSALEQLHQMLVDILKFNQYLNEEFHEK